MRRNNKNKNYSPCHSSGKKKAFFFSLGCPRNRVDTEVMIGLLDRANVVPTQYITEADFIIVNTCGFLESARRESLETIQEALSKKKEGAKVIATGCMVQKFSRRIKEQFPEIDLLIGSGDLESIITVLETQPSDIITEKKSYLEEASTPRIISTPRHWAFLKIAEGCRKRCTFCIIPQIKGPLKSKSKEQVIDECSLLLDKGVKELLFVAQDLGDWGKEIPNRESLSDLLCAILKKEKRDFWLRLLYLYPDEIDSSLLDVLQSDARICPYIDMPIQHVSDSILKRMRRKTGKAAIYSTCEKLRKAIPDIAIRTSIIVGFPGEKEEDVEEVAEFLKEVQLDQVGFFPYSQEEGSEAASFPDQLDEKTKEKRVAYLAAIQQKVVEEKNKKMIGRRVEALVDTFHPDSKLLLLAHSKRQCPELDSAIILNDFERVKEFGTKCLVEIQDQIGYDLIGKVISIH
jgi:ribosomal protein S12 methylthiotransferase